MGLSTSAVEPALRVLKLAGWVRSAFGRYVSPDLRTHPGEHIAPIATRTDVPAPTGSETVYFNVYLPSGAPPPSGWPVVIVGHGASNHKNFLPGTVPPFPPARGVAVVCINQASHDADARAE